MQLDVKHSQMLVINVTNSGQRKGDEKRKGMMYQDRTYVAELKIWNSFLSTWRKAGGRTVKAVTRTIMFCSPQLHCSHLSEKNKQSRLFQHLKRCFSDTWTSTSGVSLKLTLEQHLLQQPLTRGCLINLKPTSHPNCWKMKAALEPSLNTGNLS